ncbi:MAG: TetR/AcrR family transcriptional regulator [Burkholderiaceae bacterium]
MLELLRRRSTRGRGSTPICLTSVRQIKPALPIARQAPGIEAEDAIERIRRTADAPEGRRPPAASATQAQILAAAARLFGQQGYASTTLRQIAQASGIRAGSIYYHFGSKDEIAARVLDEGIAAVTDAVRRRLQALPAGSGMRERLAAAVEGHLWGMLHHSQFTAAHIRIYRYVSAAARARHRSVRSAYTRLWDDLLADAREHGLLRTDMPVPMVRQFLVGALNWPVDWYDPRRGSFEQLAAQITSLVLDGMVLRPGAPHRAAAAPAPRRSTAAPAPRRRVEAL